MLQSLRTLIDYGFVSERPDPNGNPLSLFIHTQECVQARHWDEFTKTARGIILDTTTGEIVARPYKKFFNYGEHKTFEPMPDLTDVDSIRVLEKADGSMVQFFYCPFEKRVRFTTKGGWASDPVLWLEKNITDDILEGMEELFLSYKDCNRPVTLVGEVFYPAGRIVLDYGQPMIMFHALISNATGKVITIDPSLIPELLGQHGPIFYRLVDEYHFDFVEDMLAAVETLPATEEGFVLRVEFDGRVEQLKLKGQEYLRLHKARFGLSPLYIWEWLINPDERDNFHTNRAAIPEEFHEYVDLVVDHFNQRANQMYSDMLLVVDDLYRIISKDAPEVEKQKCITEHFSSDPIMASMVRSFVKGQRERIFKTIWKSLKPHGNHLDLDTSKVSWGFAAFE